MHARELVGVADGGLVPAGAGVLRAELIRTGVGARLACYRRLARLTQKEVAVRAGVSREFVSMVEGGVRGVGRATLICLAAAVEVDPAALVGDRDGGAVTLSAGAVRARVDAGRGGVPVLVIADGLTRVEIAARPGGAEAVAVGQVGGAACVIARAAAAFARAGDDRMLEPAEPGTGASGHGSGAVQVVAGRMGVDRDTVQGELRRDGLGVRLTYYRRLAGLTQRQLAARAGSARQVVCMLESGTKVVMRQRTLMCLAAALDVAPAALTGQSVPGGVVVLNIARVWACVVQRDGGPALVITDGGSSVVIAPEPRQAVRRVADAGERIARAAAAFARARDDVPRPPRRGKR
jgi:transcriptional regulator with XRE-family HTH domain